MSDIIKPYNYIIDFVTGKKVPEIGSEGNRQKVERYLVENRGYDREDIEVDVDVELEIAGEPYRSQIDMVVSVAGKRVMTIKCAAASLGSWEREILSTARIFEHYQIPYSVVSDGETAIVLDTISGEKLGTVLEAIPEKSSIEKEITEMAFIPLSEKRLEKEKLIFRTYDMANVNVQRNI